MGIFTRDRGRARSFYTGQVGLAVREERAEAGLLALGATKTGEDAALAVWQPEPMTWGADYDPAVRQIGTVTGVGFETTDLNRTMMRLRERGVRIDLLGEEEYERYARFFDTDGNSLFLTEPSGAKPRRAGLRRLDFVTVVTRDAQRSETFFKKALGLTAKHASGEEAVELRVRGKGTAILPFTPKRENYDDPANYEADVGHVGENTWIFFRTRDLLGMQDLLMSRGVRFKRKAERAARGGLEAEFLDPDDNVYWLIQPA